MRRVMSESKDGTGRVPRKDSSWSPQMSQKSKSVCVRESVCEIEGCKCVGLAVRKTVRSLLFCFLSLSYLHSRGVQSFACAVLLRRLNTSPLPLFPSLLPPSLLPSLCLSFALTPAPRMLYALYETASPPLSLIQLFSPPSSLPASLSLCFSPKSLAPPLSSLLLFTSH